MGSLEEQVDRWLHAGVIDEATAARIREFEGDGTAAAQRGPGLLEALVYLGAGVVCVGVAILLGSSWEELAAWLRVVVIAGPGVLLLMAGGVLRRTDDAALARGAQVAWLAGGGLIAGTAAVVAQNTGAAPESGLLATGSVATVLGLVLWAFSSSHVQMAGIGAAVFFLCLGFGAQFSEFETRVAFLSLAAFGAAGIALTEAGVVRPRISARAVSAIAVVLGSFLAAVEGGWVEAVILAAGAALVALSIVRGAFLYVIAGVIAIFAGLMVTVVRHADSPAQASAALIVIGALLVGTVLILARTRPWAHSRAA